MGSAGQGHRQEHQRVAGPGDQGQARPRCDQGPDRRDGPQRPGLCRGEHVAPVRPGQQPDRPVVGLHGPHRQVGRPGLREGATGQPDQDHRADGGRWPIAGAGPGPVRCLRAGRREDSPVRRRPVGGGLQQAGHGYRCLAEPVWPADRHGGALDHHARRTVSGGRQPADRLRQFGGHGFRRRGRHGAVGDVPGGSRGAGCVRRREAGGRPGGGAGQGAGYRHLLRPAGRPGWRGPQGHLGQRGRLR
ncbi:hypothetical protein D9M69_438080 [compost metagenome]